MTNLPYQTDDVKLREHLEALLNEQRVYFEMKFSARDEATRVALQTMDHRLDGMNEIRGVLKDQTAQTIMRPEFSLSRDQIRAELADLQKYRNIAEGKASQGSVYFFGLLSIASLIISIIKFLI